MLEAVCRDDLAGVVMRFNGPAALQTVFLQEVLLRTTWRLMAWVVGGQLPVVRFDFAFGPLAHAGGYGKIFPRCSSSTASARPSGSMPGA